MYSQLTGHSVPILFFYQGRKNRCRRGGARHGGHQEEIRKECAAPGHRLFPESHPAPEEQPDRRSSWITGNGPGSFSLSMDSKGMGYGELLTEAREEEEEERPLSEDRAQKLDNILGHLRKGDHLRLTFYESGRYRTLEGMLESIDRP